MKTTWIFFLILVFAYILYKKIITNKNKKAQSNLTNEKINYNTQAADEISTKAVPIQSESPPKFKINWDNIPDEFIVFDLETTGLKTNKIPVDIIEISAIKIIKEKYRATGAYETFSSLIHPHRGGLNQDAMKINGITEHMIKREGRRMDEVLNEFLDFTGRRIMVAHNVDFDRWFLQREISDQGISRRFKYECSLKLARAAFPHLVSHKLTEVASFLKVNTKGAHRALIDCEMALQVYLAAKSSLPKEITEKKKKITINENPIEELQGKNITFTGTLDSFDRETAQIISQKVGMNVKIAVSKKIDFVVEGKNAGSRLIKAKEMGLKIISEQEFISMVKR